MKSFNKYFFKTAEVDMQNIKKFVSILIVFTINSFSQFNSWVPTSGPINELSGSHIPVYGLTSISNNLVFAGTKAYGLFKTTDKGMSWIKVSTALTLSNSTISYLISDRRDYLYAATSTGFFLSSNMGSTWRYRWQSLSAVQAVAVGANNKIFAGTAQGMFISTDEGNSWTNPIELLGKNVWVIKSNNNNVFAGTMGKGIYRSTNNGDSWDQLDTTNGLTDMYVWGLAIDTTNDKIFAGTKFGGLLVSTNNGNNWEKFSGFSTGGIFVHNNSIYCGTRGSGIFYSSNSGSTWDTINTGITNLFVNCFTIDKEGYIYCGSDSGVHISSSSVTGVENPKVLPNNFILYQNFPNPFNPATTVSFGLPVDSKVTLTLYSMLGEVVLKNELGLKMAGNHQLQMNLSSKASGVYFYEMEASPVDGSKNFHQVKKMILMK